MSTLDHFLGIPITSVNESPGDGWDFALELENGVEILIKNSSLPDPSIVGLSIGKTNFIEPDYVQISIGEMQNMGSAEGNQYKEVWLIDVLVDDYLVREGEITYYPIPALPEPPTDPSPERVAPGPQEGDTGDEQPESGQNPNG